jgi:FAD/FMN-containing dehydrogenase
MRDGASKREMTEAMRPETPEQVADAVATAIVRGRPLELTGGGSKRAFGRPCEAEERLDLSALTGVVLYEPEELALTAKPGTPLTEIESVLAQRRQYLAFEPGDLGPVLDGGGRSRSNIRGTSGRPVRRLRLLSAEGQAGVPVEPGRPKADPLKARTLSRPVSTPWSSTSSTMVSA